ncbi:hypothetical protein M467_14760 [Exiguobacterium chiriqhucha RW-2]|uniref:Uncharacterized protein n=1 Tax=Exiguobacterium chiriqhucha RW-2 TaxID=1345023 RepID=U1N7P4_9BACL|nr:hypothetical protein M467_14760 [Exiguobacterium chiriqhucha RW-2]
MNPAKTEVLVYFQLLADDFSIEKTLRFVSA